MKPFNWNEEKNQWLKAERNISFEDVVVHISKEDLTRVQQKAVEGVPYQTLLADVIHRFVSGRLVEQPAA